MKVLALCPFSVGVVHFDDPEPTLTVVVKASFSLSTGNLSIDQEPLYVDDAGSSGTDIELERASDFAPRKGPIDVLLVGSARSATPSRAWPFAVEIGDWKKSGFVVSGSPARELRLVAPHVRTAPHAGAPMTRVAPCRVEAKGPSLAAGFDASTFNAAPIDQRLPELRLGQPIGLTGLLGDGSRVEGWLPETLAAVFCVSGSDVSVVPMRLDTLVIDTDRDLGMLTWRGSIPRPDPGAHLVLAEGIDDTPDWEHVSSRLSQAHAREAEAWEGAASDASGPPPTPRSGVILGMAGKAQLGLFALAPAPPSPAPPRAREKEAQAPLEEEPPSTVPTSPSSPPDAPRPAALEEPRPAAPESSTMAAAPPSARREHHTLGPGDPRGVRPVLPFVEQKKHSPATIVDESTADGPPAPAAPALPFPTARAHAPPRGAAHGDVPARAMTPAHPAKVSAPEASFAPVPPVYATAPSAMRAAGPGAPPPIATPPPAPPPIQPPREPLPAEPAADLLPLDLYAKVKVAILHDRRPLAEVLEAHGLDEVQWRKEEQLRAEALSRAASQGDSRPVIALRRAMRRALDERLA